MGLKWAILIVILSGAIASCISFGVAYKYHKCYCDTKPVPATPATPATPITPVQSTP